MRQACIVEEADEDFEIWPDNLTSFNVFTACSGEWRRDAKSGALLGIRREGLKATLDMMRIEDMPAVFDDMRAMEAAVLDEMKGE